MMLYTFMLGDQALRVAVRSLVEESSWLLPWVIVTVFEEKLLVSVVSP